METPLLILMFASIAFVAIGWIIVTAITWWLAYLAFVILSSFWDARARK